MASKHSSAAVQCNSESCKQHIARLMQEKHNAEQEIIRLKEQINYDRYVVGWHFAHIFQHIKYLEVVITEKDNIVLKRDVSELKTKNEVLEQKNAILERAALVSEASKEDNIDLKRDVSELKTKNTVLEKKNQLIMIGQFVYEFCEAAASYITQLDIYEIKHMFKKEIYQLNWNTIKQCIEKNGSQIMIERLQHIERILQEENILDKIDEGLSMIRKLRLNPCHPYIYNMPKEEIMIMLTNQDETIDSAKKDKITKIINVVYRMRGECPNPVYEDAF